MITQLERIGEELERARIRLAQQEKRVKDLEERYRQVEKTTVNEIVQAANITPAQLAEILDAAKKGILGVIPGTGGDDKAAGSDAPGDGKEGTGGDTGEGQDILGVNTLESSYNDTSDDSLPDIADGAFIYPDDSGYSMFGKEDDG